MEKTNKITSHPASSPTIKRITFVAPDPIFNTREDFVTWLDDQLTQLEKSYSAFSTARNQWRENKRK